MKEIIIVLGRSQELGFSLDRKLQFSNLDFFDPKRLQELKGDIELNLKRFLNKEIETNNRPIYELNNSRLQGIYFVEAFPYDSAFKTMVLAYILNTLFKLKLLDFSQNKIFYLCHDTHFGKDQGTEKRINDDEKRSVISQLNSLLNSKLSTDNVFIATFHHTRIISKILTALKAANSNSWHDFDIVALFEKFDKDLLEEQKKKLIDIFLPLAIDMQGLTEVTDEKKREEYLEEVLSEIGMNANDISTKWNEIKTVLAMKVSPSDEPKVVLSEFYRFNNDEKKMLYFPLESEVNPGISKEKLLKYLKTPEVYNEEEFLPNWLSQAVGKIDEKISKPTNDNPDSQ